MNITDARLDRALRTIDPAAAPLTAQEEQAAEAHLRELLATSPAPTAPESLRRGRTARWLIPVAAALTVGVALSWPHGDDGAAFASWTPTARPADAAMAKDAGEGCRESLRDSLKHSGGETPPTGVDGYQQVVTEVRGTWVFTALAAKDGSTYNCLAALTSPLDALAASGGIATSQSAPVPDLGTHGLVAHSGGMYQDNHGAFTHAQGQVGRQVVSVVIRADGRTTTATLRDGYFAAWWTITPGVGPGAAHYDLTLRNGQVLRDQEPVG